MIQTTVADIIGPAIAAEKLTVTQIAQRLGVNKSTVSRCLRRARQTLYSRLRFTL